jgi:hypothetical protein
MSGEKADFYPCPCCGHLSFADPPGSFDTCDVCGWEDDGSQLRYPTFGGANAPLVVCQREPKRNSGVDEGSSEVGRDPQWRPLDLVHDKIEIPVVGKGYVDANAPNVDFNDYYYWRQVTTFTPGACEKHNSHTERILGQLAESWLRFTARQINLLQLSHACEAAASALDNSVLPLLEALKRASNELESANFTSDKSMHYFIGQKAMRDIFNN